MASYLFQIQKIEEDIGEISCTDYFWIKQSNHMTGIQRKSLYPKTSAVTLHHLLTTLLQMQPEPDNRIMV